MGKIETGRYLRAVDTGAGTKHSESLPNITGEVGQKTNTNRRGMDGGATGVFSLGSVAAAYSGDFVGQTGYSIKFNANSSSAVYQDGAKVMPDSIDVIMWRRIA